MIATTVLITILVISTSLLFTMRTFALRQQMFAEPRQVGRQAVEYVAENLRQAGVIGRGAPGFEGVIIPYINNAQTMWNNCQNAAFADLNTDIICVTRPNANNAIAIDKWPGFKHAANFQAGYSKGCAGGDDNNRSMFLDECGAWNDPHTVLLIDALGQLALVAISPWNGTNPTSHCHGAAPDWIGTYIHVVADVGSVYNPPGGHPNLVDPVYISTTSFLTLRVKNGRLQQKFGWLNPALPDDGFVDLLENVMDLQFTYYMRNGAIFNSSAATRLPDNAPTGTNPNFNKNIPQDPDQANPLSCSNVLGVGINMVTRSAAEAPFNMRRPLRYPLTADRTTMPPVNSGGVLTNPPINLRRDRLFYNQTSTNAFIRNRMLGF
jgi:hypothetical protein